MANAAGNVFKVGNKVRISTQNAANNFVPDLTYPAAGHASTQDEDAYFMGQAEGDTKASLLGTTVATGNANKLGPPAHEDLGLVAATQTTNCVIYLNAPLVAGDTFSAAGATGFASPNVAATAASVTVAAVSNAVAANKPTVTGKCYPGAVDSMIIEFSKPVEGFATGDITIVGGETIAAANIQPITSATRYRLTADTAMEASDTLTIAANSVTAQDGTTGPALATTITCASNATKPTVTSATATQTHTVASTCTSAALDERYVYTFSKTGIGAGILGDAFTITMVDSASGTAAITTAYNSVSKTLVVTWDLGAATGAQITNVVAAINADPTFGANGVATVLATNGGNDLAAASINCAAGTTTVAVTATMNAAFQPAAADILHTAISLVDPTGLVKLAMGADAVVSGTWNTNAYAGTFKNTFTLDAATQVLVKGSTSIEFGAGAVMSLNDVVNVKSTATIN
jgi:hypothetical protein